MAQQDTGLKLGVRLIGVFLLCGALSVGAKEILSIGDISKIMKDATSRIWSHRTRISEVDNLRIVGLSDAYAKALLELDKQNVVIDSNIDRQIKMRLMLGTAKELTGAKFTPERIALDAAIGVDFHSNAPGQTGMLSNEATYLLDQCEALQKTGNTLNSDFRVVVGIFPDLYISLKERYPFVASSAILRDIHTLGNSKSQAKDIPLICERLTGESLNENDLLDPLNFTEERIDAVVVRPHLEAIKLMNGVVELKLKFDDKATSLDGKYIIVGFERFDVPKEDGTSKVLTPFFENDRGRYFDQSDSVSLPIDGPIYSSVNVKGILGQYAAARTLLGEGKKVLDPPDLAIVVVTAVLGVILYVVGHKLEETFAPKPRRLIGHALTKVKANDWENVLVLVFIIVALAAWYWLLPKSIMPAVPVIAIAIMMERLTINFFLSVFSGLFHSVPERASEQVQRS